jgi:hypothetical protein
MFVEMPLDNRTMKETATKTPRHGHRDLDPPSMHPPCELKTTDDGRNELIFRRRRHFRNIETDIRQYA